ncbi:MAG: hypothetical protein HY016_06425 [Nitrosomonadales bacterium]|nr:hypothetical protein [Nitrosomonadales bacterium]
MSFLRYSLLALSLLAFSGSGFAAERPHGTVSKAEQSVRGTWYSAEDSLTFKDDGTIIFKGKRYYYAVTNGGLIQLSGKHSSNAIPYQLAGGKLTLRIDGQPTVYLRHKPPKKH